MKVLFVIAVAVIAFSVPASASEYCRDVTWFGAWEGQVCPSGTKQGNGREMASAKPDRPDRASPSPEPDPDPPAHECKRPDRNDKQKGKKGKRAGKQKHDKKDGDRRGKGRGQKGKRY